MENSYIWSINGCEFEVDMEDAETVEKYIFALKIIENSDNRQVSNISEKSAHTVRLSVNFTILFLARVRLKKFSPE